MSLNCRHTNSAEMLLNVEGRNTICILEERRKPLPKLHLNLGFSIDCVLLFQSNIIYKYFL